MNEDETPTQKYINTGVNFTLQQEICILSYTVVTLPLTCEFSTFSDYNLIELRQNVTSRSCLFSCTFTTT